MKKALIAFFAFFAIATINSCKKSIDSNRGQANSTVITANVNAWLEKQKNPNKPNRSNNVETLKAHLNFAAMHEEKDERGSTLVIPIDNEFRSLAKLSNESTLNLVAVLNKDGSIRDVQVAVYTPAKDQHISELPDNTFHNIFHTAKDITDGQYWFLTPAGTQLYRLEYKNGRMSTEGLVTNNSATSSKQANGVRANTITCTDWVLETTFFDSEGNVTLVITEPLGTTCGDECDNGMFMSLCGSSNNNGGSGGGGGGNETAYHYAKNYTHTWLVANINNLGIYMTNYFTVEDDYFLTAIGFGPVGKSISDTTTKVEKVYAFVQINGDWTEGYTTCIARLTYANDPDNPVTLPEGSRNWTVPQIKNP